MEVSALKLSGGVGLHGRSPLLRLQSDERLVALIRRGNQGAFEVLVARYQARLLAFCRHLLGGKEDAEDVLQEVMAAAYNAIMADERAINVRPWLYRIARNRSLNHLRRAKDVGVDSMDIHFAEHGTSTADRALRREEFRLLVADIGDLPETQRTALVLREMDALSYEQIAEAMETTVPSVKSLLVRARVSLAEAAEARALTCDEVRDELGELAEGLKRKMSPPVRRHLKNCQRCEGFRLQLKETNKALAALLPLGPLVLFKKLALLHFGHHAGSGAAAGTGAAGSGAAGSGAGAGVIGSGASVAGGTAAGASAITSSGSVISAGIGAIAAKGAAGLAAAALVTVGAVAVDHSGRTRAHHARHHTSAAVVIRTLASTPTPLVMREVAQHVSASTTATATVSSGAHGAAAKHHRHATRSATAKTTSPTGATTTTPTGTTTGTGATGTGSTGTGTTTPSGTTTGTTPTDTTTTPGRTQTQTVPTVLPPTTPATTPTPTPTATTPATTNPPATSTGTSPPVATSPPTAPPTGTAASATPTSATPTGTAPAGTTPIPAQ